MRGMSLDQHKHWTSLSDLEKWFAVDTVISAGHFNRVKQIYHSSTAVPSEIAVLTSPA